MAVDFFTAYHKFIRKINRCSLLHCLMDIREWFIIQHLLAGCKYPWGEFVPPSMQLPDKLSLCVTYSWSTSRFSALAKAKGPLCHLLGIPDVPTFLLFGQVGGPLLYIHQCKHMSLEFAFPGSTKAAGAAMLCEESALGLPAVGLSPCGLPT